MENSGATNGKFKGVGRKGAAWSLSMKTWSRDLLAFPREAGRFADGGIGAAPRLFARFRREMKERVVDRPEWEVWGALIVGTAVHGAGSAAGSPSIAGIADDRRVLEHGG